MKTTKIGDHTISVVESAEELAEALGIKPGDEVQIITPQFDRGKGEPPPRVCPPRAVLENLASWGVEQLRSVGLRAWNNPDDPEDADEPQPDRRSCVPVGYRGFGPRGQLWLFPAEWYDDLPAGLDVVDINGCHEKFVPGETDDDRRFGCLAYGIVKVIP